MLAMLALVRPIIFSPDHVRYTHALAIPYMDVLHFRFVKSHTLRHLSYTIIITDRRVYNSCKRFGVMKEVWHIQPSIVGGTSYKEAT